MSTRSIHSLTLNDGHTIPRPGFGGDQIPPEQTEAAASIALEAGYRHIDMTAVYCNEAETGATITASSLPRDELLVTTNACNNDPGRDRTRRAVESSLSKLGLDHLDLDLIHCPVPVIRHPRHYGSRETACPLTGPNTPPWHAAHPRIWQKSIFRLHRADR